MREPQVQACRQILPQRTNAKSGITLPEGVKTAQDKLEKGRAVCQECFQCSDSFYRQQPMVT